MAGAAKRILIIGLVLLLLYLIAGLLGIAFYGNGGDGGNGDIINKGARPTASETGSPAAGGAADSLAEMVGAR